MGYSSCALSKIPLVAFYWCLVRLLRGYWFCFLQSHEETHRRNYTKVNQVSASRVCRLGKDRVSRESDYRVFVTNLRIFHIHVW